MNRIFPFLPNYKHLLVDSDAIGTTDIDIINKFINDNEYKVIYTTFKSAEELLFDIVIGNEYLIVDEVHNIINRDKLCEFCNKFENSLFMSATIPEELYEVIEDVDKVFTYGIAEAIQNKYICDYEILLPLIVYDEKEKNDILVNDLNAKALFLATGMLQDVLYIYKLVLYIIASVRILDEAIDIPKCDS